MHNESLCALEFIKRGLAVMRQENDSFEVILVDDGSQDNTLDIFIDESKKQRTYHIFTSSKKWVD